VPDDPVDLVEPELVELEELELLDDELDVEVELVEEELPPFDEDEV